ncbi:MAG: hypothetical protein MZV63_00490 [Marinilabiliales bacterium]|nr:hypothetical protein [Marinilabiliales bacterium]
MIRQGDQAMHGAQAMKGAVSHLRTRISDKGMDYKGYNIAVHEFGHNVEQTISLYDVDYYMLSGVPNTGIHGGNGIPVPGPRPDASRHEG